MARVAGRSTPAVAPGRSPAVARTRPTAAPRTIALVSDSYAPRVDGIATLLSEGLLVPGPEVGVPRVLLAASTRPAAWPTSPHYDRLLLFRAVPLGPGGYPVALDLLAVWRTLDRIDPHVVEVHTLGPMGVVAMRWARTRRRRLHFVFHTDLVMYGASHRPAAALLAALLLGAGLIAPKRAWFGRAPVAEQIVKDILSLFAEVRTLSPKAEHVLDRLGFRRAVRRTILAPAPGTSPGGPPRTHGRGAPVVGYIGRLSKEKNLGLLVEALSLVAEQDAGIRFHIAGPDGDRGTRRTIDRFVADHAARTRFFGAVARDDLSSFYGGVDLVVVPSTTETLCLVMREALHARCEVLVVDPGLAADRADDPHVHLAAAQGQDLSRAILAVTARLTADRGR